MNDSIWKANIPFIVKNNSIMNNKTIKKETNKTTNNVDEKKNLKKVSSQNTCKKLEPLKFVFKYLNGIHTGLMFTWRK